MFNRTSWRKVEGPIYFLAGHVIGTGSGEKFVGHVVHAVSMDLLLSLNYLVQLT